MHIIAAKHRTHFSLRFSGAPALNWRCTKMLHVCVDHVPTRELSAGRTKNNSLALAHRDAQGSSALHTYKSAATSVLPTNTGYRKIQHPTHPSSCTAKTKFVRWGTRYSRALVSRPGTGGTKFTRAGLCNKQTSRSYGNNKIGQDTVVLSCNRHTCVSSASLLYCPPSSIGYPAVLGLELQSHRAVFLVSDKSDTPAADYTCITLAPAKSAPSVYALLYIATQVYQQDSATGAECTASRIPLDVKGGDSNCSSILSGLL